MGLKDRTAEHFSHHRYQDHLRRFALVGQAPVKGRKDPELGMSGDKTLASLVRLAPTSSDSELLRRWLDGHNEAPFEEPVGRYAGLVRMAATRAGCDAATPAEAAQLTFIALARESRSLKSRPTLGGGLYLTAVLQAKNALSLQRLELRKRKEFRTQMDTRDDPATESWQRLQPLLNDAMKALSEGDREMLLLRFYRSPRCHPMKIVWV
jgi:DNA-directed RNA polymerase specialized sigma24 family protein